MPAKINYSGQKYGHLTLLSYSRPGGAQVGAYWLTKCDCGEVKEVIAKDIVKGRIKTCGKCQYHRDLIQKGTDESRKKSMAYRKSPSGMEIGHRHLYKTYCENAAHRGYSWNLSQEDFLKLTKGNCHYCNTPPSKEFKRQGRRYYILYNGIDRVDNSLGYTLQNCVSCCTDCRRMKGTYSVQKFRDLCMKVAVHTVESMAARDQSP